MERYNNLYTVNVKSKQLVIIYSKIEYGLYNLFSSDSRMKEYIENNLEEAFNSSILLLHTNKYILNIASVEDFGMFEWKYEKDLLNKLLSIFMPIILKFMEDALIGIL